MSKEGYSYDSPYRSSRLLTDAEEQLLEEHQHRQRRILDRISTATANFAAAFDPEESPVMRDRLDHACRSWDETRAALRVGADDLFDTPAEKFRRSVDALTVANLADFQPGR